MEEKKTLELEEQQERQEREQQEQYEAQLEKAAELLDENGDLDASKYLDAIKAEKARRREQRTKVLLDRIAMAVIAVVFFCGLITTSMVIFNMIVDRVHRDNLRNANYVVDDINNYFPAPEYKTYAVDDANAVDFTAMIEDHGGKNVRYDAVENTINFEMADGTSVSFRSEEVYDYDCCNHLVSGILVKGVDPNICPVVDVESKPDNMAFAADANFSTSKSGAEALEFFLSAEVKNIDDRINLTKKYIKNNKEEEDDE